MRKVLAFNLTGRVINGLLPLYFLPGFFFLLGPESFGFYCLLLSVQAILGFLDIGISSTVTREFSRKMIIENKASILTTFERLHMIVGACVVVVSITTIAFIENFLPLSLSKIDDGISPLACGIFLITSWPLPFYSGALIGGELQIHLNIINFFSGVSRYGLGYLILSMTEYGISGLLYWQAITFIATVITMRSLLVRHVADGLVKGRFSLDIIRIRRQYIMNLFGISLIGASLSQLDKIILPALIGLESFGFYSLAAALAAALMVTTHPIISTYFPRFVQALETRDTSTIEKSFKSCALALSILVLAPSTVAIVQPAAAFRLWTGRVEDMGVAVAFLPLLTLAAHAGIFTALLQSLHTAGGKPHHVLVTNVTQFVALLAGFSLAYILKESRLAIWTLLVVQITGLIMLIYFLPTIKRELSWRILNYPLIVASVAYVSAAFSGYLIEQVELTNFVGLLGVPLVLIVTSVTLVSSVLWAKTVRLKS